MNLGDVVGDSRRKGMGSHEGKGVAKRGRRPHPAFLFIPAVVKGINAVGMETES